MVVAFLCKPLTACYIECPVQVQWNSYYIEITNYLSMRLLFYFVNKAVHGDCDLGKIHTKPLTIECCGHSIIVFRSDIHNARNEGNVAIITGTVNRRNKLIVEIFG